VATVAALWRHPIKSHGREAMESLQLVPGQTIANDRRWAVVHDASSYDLSAPQWAPCQHFMRGSRTPALAATRAQCWADQVILTHPRLGEISFDPDDPADAARFIDWITPLCPAGHARPRAVVRVEGRGMTDTDYPSVSLINHASHDAVASRIGRPLEAERWRANIWLAGISPWAETAWPGQRLRIGEAELLIREPIQRCLHTAANPQTGERDADTLGALEILTGTRDFGVYAEATSAGTIRTGDVASIIG
jgi:uncharacterized protein YcbX